MEKITLENIEALVGERNPQPIGKHRFFSVLIPFVEKDGELNLLFEVRSKSLKADPGEICFPGGHVEPDEEPCSCAVRETSEELGIPKEAVKIIGQGDILYGYANYTMYSYLGIISYEDYVNAVPSKEEVEEIFLVPLKKFKETVPSVYTGTLKPQVPADFPYDLLGIDEDYQWRIGSWRIPIYEIDDRIIWGLTARITGSLLGIIWGENPIEKPVLHGRV